MKPTKNKIFCHNASRTKMLFETENKANNFIKFNSEEIEATNGFSPKRSYYCLFCDGWHVTSIEQDMGSSKKEHFLETHITSFYNEREKIELLTKKVEAMPDNEKELRNKRKRR